MKTVYVSIGNSDDRLTQAEWSSYGQAFNEVIHTRAAQVHGTWVSPSTSPYQNACWCIEILDSDAAGLQDVLTEIRTEFRQDSYAWAEVATTKFL